MDVSSHIKEQNIVALKQIVRPLFELLDISYFEFYRLYNDGGRIVLSTHPNWDIHFFKKKYYEITPFESNPKLYKSGYKLWDACPAVNPGNVAANRDARNNFNFDHGFGILKTYDNYMNLFELATIPGNQSVNTSYLSELISIEKFITFFLNEFRPILRELEKNKIYIPFEKINPSLNEDQVLRVTNRDEIFNKKIEYPQNIFHLDDRLIKLSNREMQCLKGIIKGKTAKELAKEFNLSSRTVEDYIRNLKNKIGYKSRTIIIEKLGDIIQDNHNF